MILEILLGALVGAAIAANWDSIVSWLSDLVTKLKRAWDGIRENIPHSARIFGDLLINGMVKIMHRLYYKKDGKFFEKTTEKEVILSKNKKIIINLKEISIFIWSIQNNFVPLHRDSAT